MQEYFKRLFSRAERQIKITEYPIYYEDNITGFMIKEMADGRKFIVELDDNKQIKIIKELKNHEQ